MKFELYHLPSVLIETYWNVKIEDGDVRMVSLNVLIETYWNVKNISLHARRRCKFVLIETYWNVKAERTGLSPAF